MTNRAAALRYCSIRQRLPLDRWRRAS